MARYILSLFLNLFAVFAIAQTPARLQGVFIAKSGDTQHIWLFTDGYCSRTTYTDTHYASTWGGPFHHEGANLQVHVEYDDKQPENIGNTRLVNFRPDKDMYHTEDGLQWIKQPEQTQGLDALWRITGRKQGEHIQTIAKADRKTIKLLIDGYFQWIAINPAQKGFYGTGGGQYVFDGGKYEEQILFFSRDDARINTKLTFKGMLKNGEWHHSGISSKGDPIYEIWSRDTIQP